MGYEKGHELYVSYSAVPIRVVPGEYDNEAYFLRDVIRIDAANKYSMAMMRDGQVYVWGRNTNSILGRNGDHSVRPLKVYIDDVDGSPVRATEISAGIDHAMALGGNDILYVWGNNNYGQLGQGVAAKGITVVKPVAVLAGDNNDLEKSDDYFRTTTSFSAGTSHTVVMRRDGQVYIMGSYDWGKYDQVGITDPIILEDTMEPDRFGNEELKLYRWYVDGLKQSNFYTLQVGVLPDKYTLSQMSEEQIASIPQPAVEDTYMLIPFSELYEEYDYTYSLRLSASRKPASGCTVENIVAISSDPSVVTTQVTENGVVITSTGIGKANVAVRNVATGYSFMITVSVTEVSYGVYNQKAVAVPMVDSGVNFSIAVKANGTVWAWGSWGRYSYGSPVRYGDYYVTYPVQVSNDIFNATTPATAVAAGYDHALILREDGTVWSVGMNASGQMGIGNTDNDFGNSYTVARQVMKGANSPLTNIGQITAGGQFSAAVDKTTGAVWVWGANYFTENRSGSNLIGTLNYATSLRAGYSASHTDTLSGSVGYQHNEYMTNILMASAEHRALYLLRQDGAVFVVGSYNSEVVDGGGQSENNVLIGAGYTTEDGQTHLYQVKQYNAYAVAGGATRSKYLTDVLFLSSGYYHTSAVQGRISTVGVGSKVYYICPWCGTEYDETDNHITLTKDGDGNVTAAALACDAAKQSNVHKFICQTCSTEYSAIGVCTVPDCGGTVVEQVIVENQCSYSGTLDDSARREEPLPLRV